MDSADDSQTDLTSRIAAAKERSKQNITARELVEAGLASDRSEVRFVSIPEVRRLREVAIASGIRPEWQQHASWEEIVPELKQWLATQDQVVFVLQGVVASSEWISQRVDALQRLWRSLYLYSSDGRSGYLVNLDSEFGFETKKWGA